MNLSPAVCYVECKYSDKLKSIISIFNFLRESYFCIQKENLKFSPAV